MVLLSRSSATSTARLALATPRAGAGESSRRCRRSLSPYPVFQSIRDRRCLIATRCRPRVAVSVFVSTVSSTRLHPPTVNCFSTPLRPLACTSTPWWPQIGYSRCECCCRLCLEQQLLLVVLISFCVHVRLRVKSLLVPSALIAVSPAPLPVWFSYPCVCIQCSIR